MPDAIDFRLLSAATCAYDILADGSFTPCGPHYPAVGWVTKPAAYFAPDACINACLIGTTHADGIIRAFRGTLPPINFNIPPQVRDWLQDFEAKPIAAPPGFPQGVCYTKGSRTPWRRCGHKSLWPSSR